MNTTPLSSACEEHDEAGSCTQECADFTNSLNYGFDPYPYDPAQPAEPWDGPFCSDHTWGDA